MIEMVSETWALTDFGLEYVPSYYTIRRNELVSEEGVFRWRQHMREKIWVEREDAAAQGTGNPDFWMITEAAHLFFGAAGEREDDTQA
jgi:hypothetical protein